jgi:hypothetical protein
LRLEFPQVDSLWIDDVQHRFVEAAAAVGMGTALNRKRGGFILIIGAFIGCASWAAVICHDKTNVYYSGVILKVF